MLIKITKYFLMIPNSLYIIFEIKLLLRLMIIFTRLL